MYLINQIDTPMCDYENCSNVAYYEFTDCITTTNEDENGLISETVETVTLAKSCDMHSEYIVLKLKEEENAK